MQVAVLVDHTMTVADLAVDLIDRALSSSGLNQFGPEYGYRREYHLLHLLQHSPK